MRNRLWFHDWVRPLVIVVGLTTCCGLTSGLLAEGEDEWEAQHVTAVYPLFGSFKGFGRLSMQTLVMEAGDLEGTAVSF